MKRPFTTEERRRGGRKRAQSLSTEERRRGGYTRTAQASHLAHNRRQPSDDYWAWSVCTVRGSTGLKLVLPRQIHFLRPEQLAGPGGHPLSAREQRLLFGVYVWQATWEKLPWPLPPTDEEFFTEVARVQFIVGRDLPLAHPLNALYIAPNDFCDEGGQPWGKTRQRKLFRDALRWARAYAETIALLLRAIYGDERWHSLPAPESSIPPRYVNGHGVSRERVGQRGSVAIWG